MKLDIPPRCDGAMHPVARHAVHARLAASNPRAFSAATALSRHAQSREMCIACRLKAQRWYAQNARALVPIARHRGSFATSRRYSDDRPRDQTADAANLPSHVEGRRWQLSKDATKLLDNLLARASVAGQHINVYTGTDYSGIEALRSKIKEQEQKVKDLHSTVDYRKAAHHEAFNSQASAQREIVSLLERKSSWSPTDLERYMSLVRSEHINDQAVQAAKDNLAIAERELEDARSLLEKLERKQYHEEQIWSDTIRRNSTWVTFGLMGVNIVLLLAQLLIFEPYRRRRIVREVKSALDEKTVHTTPSSVERQIDDVVRPTGVQVEGVEDTARTLPPAQQPLDDLLVTDERSSPSQATLAAGKTLPAEAAEVVPAGTADGSSNQTFAASRTWQAYQAALRDLFSERLIEIKKVELTTAALQGAATGVAAMGLLLVLLRPR
jgi:sensitive to high expression protein 9, mitochondrial